jgi:predicted DNA-binding transcriptional regulator AlpA
MSEKLIELEVSDFDIFDEEILGLLEEFFPIVQWSYSDDKTIARFICQETLLLMSVQEFADQVFKLNSEKSKIRWYDDFIGYSEISQRTGLSAEGIRKWAKGERGVGNFPRPRGYVGLAKHRSPIWPWSEVLNWLQLNNKYSEDTEYPSLLEIDRINAVLSWSSTASQQEAQLGTLNRSNPRQINIQTDEVFNSNLSEFSLQELVKG